MKRLLIYVLLGLLVAAPGEILNQVLARHNVRAFGSTMVSYSVLLVLGWLVEKGLSAIFWKFTSRLIYYLLFGFLGLMVEWFLLGNAPVLEPFQIITQPGMFTYWGTMLLAPCLFMEPGFAGLKRSFAKYYAAFSCLYLVVAVVVPRQEGGIFFAFIVFAGGTAGLNWFYVTYFRELRKGSSNCCR